MGIGESSSGWPRKPRIGGNVVARAVLFATALAILLLQISTDALAKRKGSGRGDDPAQQMEDASREIEQQRKEQEKQAREAAKQAERQQKEQEKQAREAQKQAERQRKEQEKEQREAQKQADRQRRDQDNQVRAQQRRDDQPKSNGPDRPRQDEPQNATNGRDNNAGKVPDDNGRGGRDDARGSKERDSKSAEKRDDNSKKGDEPKTEDQQAAKDDRPPATIKEWIERGSGSSSKKQDQAESPAGQNAKPSSQVNGVVKAKGQTAQGQLAPIEFPEFRANEVLAVNLSGKALGHAQQLGFKVKAVTALNSSNVTITKLEPPSGMDALEGEAKLKQIIPASEFALNKQYSIYRTATGTEPSPAQEKHGSNGEKSVSPACAGDHCFGREIMGWHTGLNQCSKGLKIGIIDTGIDTSHAAFAGRKIEIGHMGEGGARSANWHGTGVTALLAGDARGGVSGLSPEASFAIADAFYSSADNQPASDTLSMLRALDWLEKRDVKIINMSLSGPADELIQKAIDRLTSKGVIFVAAAGNNGPNAAPSYPAAYKSVIAVTAVNKDLAGYRYANRGDYVDFAGPGVSIWTAMPGGSGTYHSGTSFAAPFVTAAIAAVYKQLPGKSADDVIQTLKSRDLGSPGKDAVYGNGLVLAPETCRGGAMASASGANTVRSAVGVQETSAQVPTTQKEILPWLGFAPE